MMEIISRKSQILKRSNRLLIWRPPISWSISRVFICFFHSFGFMKSTFAISLSFLHRSRIPGVDLRENLKTQKLFCLFSFTLWPHRSASREIQRICKTEKNRVYIYKALKAVIEKYIYIDSRWWREQNMIRDTHNICNHVYMLTEKTKTKNGKNKSVRYKSEERRNYGEITQNWEICMCVKEREKAMK